MIYSHLICNLEGVDYEVYISFKLRPPTWLARVDYEVYISFKLRPPTWLALSRHI